MYFYSGANETGTWKLIKRSMKDHVGYGRSVFMTISTQPSIDAEVIVGTENSKTHLFYYKAGVWVHSGNELTCPVNCPDSNNICKNTVAMTSGQIVCGSPDTSK